MKNILSLSLFLCLMPLFLQANDIKTVILNIGETYKTQLPANHRLWIENKLPLDVQTQSGLVTFTGKAEGHTSVQLDQKTIRFQVVVPPKKNLQVLFEKKLRTTLGLKLKFFRHQIVIDGKILRWADWLSLKEASEELETPYEMMAQIPPSLKRQLNDYLRQEVELAGLAPVSIEYGSPPVVRLSVGPTAFEKYQRLLTPFGIRVEKDPEALNIAPIVKIEITVAEIRRDLKRTYGIQWPQSYAATVLSAQNAKFEQLILNANALESQGNGRILASPSLLCRSGKEAEFLAGGEFPIKIMTVKMQDVIWKKYGVQLKVRPVADYSGRMSIGLDVEVSTIDDSRSVDGVPGILTNKMSSQFDLSTSQTIALSGLIKNEDGQSSQGLPLLGRLPIIGPLFSSKDFRENRTELVILVRPSLLRESTSTPENRPSHLKEPSYE